LEVEVDELLNGADADVLALLNRLHDVYETLKKQYGKEHSLTRRADNAFWNTECVQNDIKDLKELTGLDSRLSESR
jgi:hypothetical protein